MHKNMVEYPQHKKAKERIATILTGAGWTVSVEKEMPQVTALGERNYIADVYAEKPEIDTSQGVVYVHKIIVEVDGKVGHSGKIAMRKQAMRDQAFLDKGIHTVRFPTPWIIGKKACTDGAILEQINWKASR